jgi:RNA polymerase sigma-70 factor, ECF subfamily
MDQHASKSAFVLGLKNADWEAWRGAYAQFGAMIYRMARGMVGAADAEDVAQETFLQAFRKRNQFRGTSTKELECWLCRIALNKCRDSCRRRQNQPVFSTVADWSEIGTDARSVEKRVDDLDLLQEGLQGVTPPLRTVLLLHLAGRSYREIGRILKIKSKATISERLGLAREQLRRSLTRLGWSE